MEDKLIITLPLPPRCLHPNAKNAHWATRANHIKRYRRDAGLAIWDAVNRAGVKEPYTYGSVLTKFYLRGWRRRDNDNLTGWLKSGYDAMQDAKLILNDSGLIVLPARWYIDRDERVVLEFEPLAEDEYARRRGWPTPNEIAARALEIRAGKHEVTQPGLDCDWPSD